MKRFSVCAALAVALSLGLGCLAGCGGSSSNGETGPIIPVASIASFVANPAMIVAGKSTNLTGVFSNGDGVITPGNISVTSATPVSVSPTATTTYTLTVTPTTGASVSSNATVTVVLLPSISSFVADPATIVTGSSSSLTAVFSNGAGAITPGNLAVTSGTPVSVSPTVTTTYTLTVTPASGTAITQTVTVTVQSLVSVDQSTLGPPVTDKLMGMNMGMWYDQSTPAIVPAFQATGIKAMRWPGGSASDDYHWENNSGCAGTPLAPSYWISPNDQFPEPLTSELIAPLNLDVALTANYGTNATCTGPGEPSEAAAWAASALANGNYVTHITVGNEQYGSWEDDLHNPPNDPTTYANVTATGFYPDIKAASPNVLVGVSVNPGNSPPWDPIVLANAKYDFVEYHYYPQYAGGESDSYLVQDAAPDLTVAINTIKLELATAGRAETPIYVGEIGSVSTNPGKQSMSITQALYAGQVLGEMMNDGVSRATWWIGFGGCEDSASGSGANFSSSLYGWQDFGGYMLFSDGLPESGCENETLAAGTPLPTARVYELFSHVAIDGENALTAAVAGDTADLRAYAATNSGGAALVLFNLNETTSQPVVIDLSAQSSASSVTVETYSKAIYDQSKNNVWAPPTTTSLGAQNLPLALTLDPWSMNVVIIH